MNTTVAFKADFDGIFPELRAIGQGDDRVPGRPIAGMIMHGLRQRGFDTSEIVNNEPFFTITCKVGAREYFVDASIAWSDPGPIWQVSCGRDRTLWERLKRTAPGPEPGKLVDAIGDILKKDPRVHETRWFEEPQFDPWSRKGFSDSAR